MKDKKITYVLIPVVLLIWGYVAYSIMTFGEEDEDIEPIRIGTIISQKADRQEERTLSLNYRDPFLKNVRRKRSASVKRTEPKKAPEKAVKNIDWGNITFNGYIQNKESNKRVGLLNVSGRQVLAANGEAVGDITVMEIRQDSVLLKKEGVTRWFLKFKNSNQ